MYWRQELKEGRKEELRAIFEENGSEDVRKCKTCPDLLTVPQHSAHHTVTLSYCHTIIPSHCYLQGLHVRVPTSYITCKKTYFAKTDWTLQKHTSEHRSKTKERGIWWKHQCHTGCKGKLRILQIINPGEDGKISGSQQ